MLFREQTVAILIVPVLFCAACHGKKETVITEFVTNHRAAIFVFLAPDCPLSQGYMPALNRLRKQFAAETVEFYGVFSGRGSEKGAMDDFVKTYDIQFPALPDPKLTLATFFGAAKTPEVFAVDSNQQIFYKGEIDNWAPELGQHRQVITEHYLQDALNSFLEHRRVQVQQTDAVGCFIEQ